MGKDTPLQFSIQDHRPAIQAAIRLLGWSLLIAAMADGLWLASRCADPLFARVFGMPAILSRGAGVVGMAACAVPLIVVAARTTGSGLAMTSLALATCVIRVAVDQLPFGDFYGGTWVSASCACGALIALTRIVLAKRDRGSWDPGLHRTLLIYGAASSLWGLALVHAVRWSFPVIALDGASLADMAVELTLALGGVALWRIGEASPLRSRAAAGLGMLGVFASRWRWFAWMAGRVLSDGSPPTIPATDWLQWAPPFSPAAICVLWCGAIWIRSCGRD